MNSSIGGSGVAKFGLLALATVLALTLPPLPLLAQDQPGEYTGDQQPPVDPPSRVGRLSYVWGGVSFRSFDADHWDPAPLNYPVTSGASFWTEPGARARVEVGRAALTLDASTEVDITLLDDQNFQATIPQGRVNFRLGVLLPGQSYQFTTPGGTVAIATPGRYHVDAGDSGRPPTIAVFEGTALVQSANNRLVPVEQSQMMAIAWGDAQPTVWAAEPQELDSWSDQSEAPVSQIARYVSPDMPGAGDLAAVGYWQPRPDYGAVWYPPVDASWAPYRYGHWGYVAPWGWTWIDDAPWGFAPFHYGRWAFIDGRWGWIPGRVSTAPPVYSPALVVFVGGAALGAGSAVGWIPLGPREAYVPPYRTSPTYVRSVNVTQVTNVNVINVTNVTVNNYANARAATVVPGTAMTGSQPIARARVNVPPTALAQARVGATAAVKPSMATVGASPGVVKAVGGNLAERPRHAGAPGPAVQRQPVPASVVRSLGGHPAPGAPATPAAAAAAGHARPPAPAAGETPPSLRGDPSHPPRPLPTSQPGISPPPLHPTPPAAGEAAPHVPPTIPAHPAQPTAATPHPDAPPPSNRHPEPVVATPSHVPPPSPPHPLPTVSYPHPDAPPPTHPVEQPVAAPQPPHPGEAAAPPHAVPAQGRPAPAGKPEPKCDPKLEHCP